MKRSSLLLAFSLTVLLVGCGDERMQEKPQKIEKISKYNAKESEVQKREPLVVVKEREEKKRVVEGKSILENAILATDTFKPLDQNRSVSTKKEGAISSTKVEAAKAATSATIAQSVDDAEAVRTATSPRPAATIQEAKDRASIVIAKSVISEKVLKEKATSSMAKSVEKVETNERLYEEESLRVKAEFIRESVTHGQKIYIKELKNTCGMNGAEFAALHSQAEWEEIRNIGSFGHEVEKRCPKLDTFKEKWESDLFDFCYEYAKDSGNVPSRG